MIKSTERGLEKLGDEVELSEEDREFIHDMFEELSNYQSPEYGYDLFHER